MNGICNFCSSKTEVKHLNVVEVVDYRKPKLIYKQIFLGALLCCWNCRFRNSGLYKWAYILLLVIGIFLLCSDLHQQRFVVCSFYLFLCGLVGMLQYFRLKKGMPKYSEKLKLLLLEKGLVNEDILNRNCRLDNDKLIYLNRGFSLFKMNLPLLFVFMMISVYWGQAEESYKSHKRLGIMQINEGATFCKSSQRSVTNAYSIVLTHCVNLENKQICKDELYGVHVKNDILNYPFSSYEEEKKVKGIIENYLTNEVRKVKNVIVAYDSTNLSDTEYWHIILERSGFENSGFSLQNTIHDLKIDSTATDWKGYFNLMHLISIMENGGMVALNDTLKNRQRHK